MHLSKSNILILAVSLLFLFSFLPAPPSAAEDIKAAYEEALGLAKEKDYDTAFMKFRTFLREFPDSGYASGAAFAVCEYYYEKNMNNEAMESLKDYLETYPESNATIVARAMLLKIIQRKLRPTFDMEELISTIVKTFFSKPLLILFSDHKELEYISPFQNEFLIRHYLDRIEVHKNGELFFEISQ